MTAKRTVAVVGGSGYGGGELIRRLLLHPHMELVRVASIDHVGEPLASAHPNLEQRTSLRFEALDPVDAARGVDVAMFALPHDVSARVVPEVLRRGSARVVDLSGAFRCRDAATYARWYETEHPSPEALAEFVYGLPEYGGDPFEVSRRSSIAGARGVASPGCFATAIELALLPLARRRWLEGPVEVVGMTGSSGSGVTPSAGTHHPSRSVTLRPYRPLTHPQTPEIVDTLKSAGAAKLELSFVPVSAPLSRGILVSAFARVPADRSEAEIRAAYEEAYADEPFVRMPQRRLPEVAAVAGSNHAEVGVAVGPALGPHRVVSCFAALDNLIKGGAGQAIQSLNLMLGFDERTALEDPGSWP